MQEPVRATFRSVQWDEVAIEGEDAQPKLTRASCRQVYRGDIAGESTLEYLMVYHGEGAATFVGVERIAGTVKGREGSFAVQHRGVFAGGVAKMAMEIVEGAGTGELAGLTGTGEFESPHAEEYEVTLSCSFAD